MNWAVIRIGTKKNQNWRKGSRTETRTIAVTGTGEKTRRGTRKEEGN
jgi:hypothetical protein